MSEEAVNQLDHYAGTIPWSFQALLVESQRPQTDADEAHPDFDRLCVKLGDKCCPHEEGQAQLSGHEEATTPWAFQVVSTGLEDGWCGKKFFRVQSSEKEGSGSTTIPGEGPQGTYTLTWTGNHEITKTYNTDGTYLGTYSGTYYQTTTYSYYDEETESFVETTNIDYDVTLSGETTSPTEAEPEWEGTQVGSATFSEDPDGILTPDWEYSQPVTFSDQVDLLLQSAGEPGEWEDMANNKVTSDGATFLRWGDIRLKAEWAKKWIAEFGTGVRFHYRLAKRTTTRDCATNNVVTDEWEWITEEDSSAQAPVTNGEKDVFSNALENLPLASELMPATEKKSVQVLVTGPSYAATPRLLAETAHVALVQPCFAGYLGEGYYATETVTGDYEFTHIASPSNYAVPEELDLEDPAYEDFPDGLGVFWLLSPTIGDTRAGGLLLFFQQEYRPAEITNTTRVYRGTKKDGTPWELVYTLSEEIEAEALETEAAETLDEELDALPEPNVERRARSSYIVGAGGLSVCRQKTRYRLALNRPNLDGPLAQSTVSVRWKVWTLDAATGELSSEQQSETLEWDEDPPEGSPEWNTTTRQPSEKMVGLFDLDAEPGQVKWIEPLPLEEAMHYYEAPVWEVYGNGA